MRPIHYANVSKAFQLHYLLQFQTWRALPVFAEEEAQRIAARAAHNVCLQNQGSLLSVGFRPNQMELVASLRPEHSPAKFVTRLKTNVSRLFFAVRPPACEDERRLWGGGKTLGTSGKADLATVLAYVQKQYPKDYPHNLHRIKPSPFTSPMLAGLRQVSAEGHWRHLLLYHIVFTSERHTAVLSEPQRTSVRNALVRTGQDLARPILSAEALYNHVHFVARGRPDDPPGDLAESFLNALTERIRTESIVSPWRVFQSGLYVGSVGEHSTAVVKSWLKKASPDLSEGRP